MPEGQWWRSTYISRNDFGGLSIKKGLGSVQGGWTVADDHANNTLWSFAPEGYPAYPAAVKREIKEAKDAIYIHMHILCEASKAACDKLVVDFQKLNESIRQRLAQPR
jgi:hypothetical protein